MDVRTYVRIAFDIPSILKKTQRNGLQKVTAKNVNPIVTAFNINFKLEKKYIFILQKILILSCAIQRPSIRIVTKRNKIFYFSFTLTFSFIYY